MKNIIGFLSGLIFGIGLIISGMTNPAKVIGFLDITGEWDVSLALVMGGALLVAGVGFFIAKRKVAHNQTSIAGEPINIPMKTELTPQLIGGSVLFGVGWGLAGICPGPALVMFSSYPITGAWQAVVFVLAMLVGVFGYQLIQKK